MAGLRVLKLVQVSNDLGRSPVGGANKFPPDDSVLVDDVGFRRAGGSEGEVALLGSVKGREQINVVVGDVGSVGGFFVIEADGEYDHLGHIALELNEGRELLQAGRAPGGPEVEDDDLAAVVGEADGAVGVGDGEAGRGCADLAGMVAAIASGE